MLPGFWHDVDEERVKLRATWDRRAVGAASAIAATLALSGCGSSSSSSTAAGAGSSRGSSGGSSTASSARGSGPTVLAAASLTKVFPEITPGAKYTFGGSGALETDIEQ